jgi:hypothetical protein
VHERNELPELIFGARDRGLQQRIDQGEDRGHRCVISFTQ